MEFENDSQVDAYLLNQARSTTTAQVVIGQSWISAEQFLADELPAELLTQTAGPKRGASLNFKYDNCEARRAMCRG